MQDFFQYHATLIEMLLTGGEVDISKQDDVGGD